MRAGTGRIPQVAGPVGFDICAEGVLQCNGLLPITGPRSKRNEDSSMSTTVIRIPNEVHDQATRVAALCGEQPGALLARAWNEFIVNHREHFAADLEEAARLMRSAPVEELVAFTQDSHYVLVDEDDLQAALEDPRLQRFLSEAVATGERMDREGRRF